MNHIKRNLFLVLLLACSSCCFAKQISFQVVQHNNSLDKVTEESYFIEDTLISNFFDNGYIVTNSVASVSNSEDSDKSLWSIGAKDALDGGSDYFVQVILYFTEKKDEIINKKVMILEKVGYSVCLTKSLDVLSSGSLSCNLRVYDSKDLTVVSKRLVDEIFKVIKA